MRVGRTIMSIVASDVELIEHDPYPRPPGFRKGDDRQVGTLGARLREAALGNHAARHSTAALDGFFQARPDCSTVQPHTNRRMPQKVGQIQSTNVQFAKKFLALLL